MQARVFPCPFRQVQALACVLGCGRALVSHPAGHLSSEAPLPCWEITESDGAVPARHHPRPPRCGCGQVPTPQAFLVPRLTKALWPWLLLRLVEGMPLLLGGWVGLKTSGHFSPFSAEAEESQDRTPAWPRHICHSNWCVFWGVSLDPTHPVLRGEWTGSVEDLGTFPAGAGAPRVLGWCARWTLAWQVAAASCFCYFIVYSFIYVMLMNLFSL